MKPKIKKALKITGISILIILALLIAIPFVFQSQIKNMVKKQINENLNAKVEFSDVDLSLLRSFPKAYVTISDLSIVNFKPFENETLLTSKSIAFTMSVKELLKTSGDEPIIINTITINEAMLTLKTNKNGVSNYDITKESPENSSSEPFTFDIDSYKVTSSAVTYLSEESNILFHVFDLNHTGNGSFSSKTSELNTKSTGKISLTMDGTNYLKNNSVSLDALIGMDLENDVYTFKDNKGFINKLPITFKGFVKLLDEGQDMDITFENPGSSFKDFLAVIPEVYSKNIENVNTTGDFKVKGQIKGKMTETTIPTFEISINSNNASFKYPSLPKKVDQITIDTTIKNESGVLEDTYVNINAFNFKIDNDWFKSSAMLKNIMGNMLVDASIEGTLNLANISKAYPIEQAKDLSGIIKGKLKTAFDMKALETNAYERIKNSGYFNVSNVKFTSSEMKNPVQISTADLKFNPTTVSLVDLKAKTGQSDFEANGTLKNLIGFMLSDAKLQGQFNLNSNTFAVNDFMTTTATTKTTNNTEGTKSTAAPFKIPSFLDCTINAKAKQVLYDNLNLSDVNGTLVIKDQKASLINVTTTVFDGKLGFSGHVNTQTDVPVFEMNLDASNFNITKSFEGIEMLQKIAPIAKVLQGILNTNINISGSLDKDLTPNLSTLSGKLAAEILSSTIKPETSQLISKLSSTFNFIDFSKLDLNKLKTHVEFKDGQVTVKPFNINYKDISMEVSGNHGFDKSLSYKTVLNVPAKYLGSDVNRLIGKIDETAVNNLTIPVTANISGSFTSPNVKTDLTSGVTNLTKQLIEIEKQKALNKGKDKVQSLITGVIDGNSKKTTTTNTQTDSTKTSSPIKPSGQVKETVKEGVKNVLGGMLKKKKKDSIN